MAIPQPARSTEMRVRVRKHHEKLNVKFGVRLTKTSHTQISGSRCPFCIPHWSNLTGAPCLCITRLVMFALSTRFSSTATVGGISATCVETIQAICFLDSRSQHRVSAFPILKVRDYSFKIEYKSKQTTSQNVLNAGRTVTPRYITQPTSTAYIFRCYLWVSANVEHANRIVRQSWRLSTGCGESMTRD